MSYQLKNKKTGLISIVTDDEYAEMVNKNTIINRFTCEKITTRSIIPSIKVPDEIKTPKNTKK